MIDNRRFLSAENCALRMATVCAVHWSAALIKEDEMPRDAWMGDENEVEALSWAGMLASRKEHMRTTVNRN